MTFLEQLRANNDPNSEARRTFRNMAAPKLTKSVATEQVISSTMDNLGQQVSHIVDENGENWEVIKGWSWDVQS